jgi:glycosyltransferase 2 family protein
MAVRSTRSVLQFVVLLGVGILFIWLSLKQVAPEKDRIIEAFSSANYFWIAVAMFVSFFSHFFRAFRWNLLLKPLGHKVDPVNGLCHVLVGYFANYGIPRMGEITRCSLAAKYDKVPFEVGFGTVVTERIVDFFIFLLIFLLTLAVQFTELIGLANELIFDKIRIKLDNAARDPAGLIIVISIVVLFIAAIFFLRKKMGNVLRGKVGKIIRGMAEGVGSISKLEHPIRFVFLSLLIWACYFYSLYVCFFALEGTSHLGQKECLTLLLFGTFGVIVSPGGLGAYPAIIGGILMYTYNIDLVNAFALPWLSWTCQFALVLLLGIIALIILPLYNKNRNVVSQTA